MPDGPPQQPQTASAQQINWKRFGAIVAAAVVILAILIGLWWWIFGRVPAQPPLVNKVPTKTSTPSAKPATPSAKKDETEGWKVYTNSDLGFSVRYPSEWFLYDKNTSCAERMTRHVFIDKKRLVDCGSYGDGPAPADFYILVGDKPYTLPKTNAYDTYEPIKISGEEGVLNFTTEKSERPRETNTIVIVNHNGRGYQIVIRNVDNKGTHNPIFDQILSTFQFLD